MWSHNDAHSQHGVTSGSEWETGSQDTERATAAGSAGRETYLVTAPENILSIILVEMAAETESGREPRARARGHGLTSRELAERRRLGQECAHPGREGARPEDRALLHALPGPPP